MATKGAVRAAESITDSLERLGGVFPDGSKSKMVLTVAKLIDQETGAPELLDALENLLKEVDHKRYNIRKDTGFFIADAVARSAIAKARGEA